MNQTRQIVEDDEGGTTNGHRHEYASPAKIQAMGTALYNTLRKKKKKKPPPEVRCRPAHDMRQSRVGCGHRLLLWVKFPKMSPFVLVSSSENDP